MTGLVLYRSNVRVLLWHLALYGLGAILEDAGIRDVHLSWTPGMQPRAQVTGRELTRDLVDQVVREHAHSRAREPSWLLRDVEVRGKKREEKEGSLASFALMSPRVTPFDGRQVWQDVQEARHRELDRLTESATWLDLRLLAALGEPCYWSRNRQDKVLQDDGASRFEMQPRNHGSEIVGSRLRKLADAVGSRHPGAVSAGLEGWATEDEVGSNKVDSRTSTGLASPGPTDNAVAWCALWGISQLPSSYRTNGTAVTSGHIGASRNEWFYVPVWEQALRPARLRSILAAQPLRESACSELPDPWGGDVLRAAASRHWLAARGIVGVMRFPIERFGSKSAPERRAMLGVALTTGAP